MNKKNKCPNCEIDMNLVQVSSHYGVNIFVDQCDRCGGLWFDDGEHFRVGVQEHEKFKKIDFEKFKKDFKIKTKLLCPKDGQELKILDDKYFSEKLEVDYCPKCSGFWFNYGEFKEFQKERNKKIGKQKKKLNKDEKLEQQIEAMMSSYSVASKYNAIGDIGRHLSSDVSRTKARQVMGGVNNNDPVNNIIRGVYLIISSIFIMLASGKKKR
jgi:Zn-finger nucleic acid-binding protein